MVKALFPIGKTQWAKWDEMQRRAFNTLREQGKSFDDAVALASSMADVFEPFEPKTEEPKPETKAVETVKPAPAPIKHATPKKKGPVNGHRQGR